MRVSNSEAEQTAIELAVSFLTTQPPAPGWEWKVVDASPDLFASEARDRKAWICWAVVVEWSKNGSVVFRAGLCIRRTTKYLRQY